MAQRTEPLNQPAADQKYPRGFYTVTTYTDKREQALCVCCNAPATGRSSMNIHGNICDFQTCAACDAKQDGVWADSIPLPERAVES